MKPPARAVAGNLVLSADDGSAWAVYRVHPTSYNHLSDQEKLALHARFRAALLLLPGESAILSVCREIDSAELERRMLEGADTFPWRLECEATRAAVERMASDGPMFDRVHFLSVKLTPAGRSGLIGDIIRGAATTVLTTTGLPSTPIPANDLAAYRRQTNEFDDQLAALIHAYPATSGEIRWLYARLPVRGVAEPRYDGSWEPAESALTLTHLFNDARVFEGGHRPSLVAGGRRVDVPPDADPPRHRRYVRFDTDHGSSYQTSVVLSSMPREWSFPGGRGEWFAPVYELPFPVDACARILPVANEKAQTKARQQARELVAQVAEYDAEPSGPPAVLAEAMEELERERSLLALNTADPELQVTTWFSLACADLPTLEQRARQVVSLFQPNEYGAHRPSGDQSALVRATLPGSSLPRAARDYAQFLLPSDFASSMPFVTSVVGDDTGILVGSSRGAGSFAPVLLSVDRAPLDNRSGSLAVFGQLGAGKSMMCKALARAVLARGGQVVVADRTNDGEYVRFADVCPGRHSILDMSPGSPFVIDPMRVFSGEERLQYATGVLALLAGTSPISLEGVVLSEAVEAVADRPGCRLVDVVSELESRTTDPDARVVARKLGALARTRQARMIFGEGEAMALDADLLVFHLRGIVLPDKAMLTNEHLARNMLPEQLLGYSLLYLVAAVTRHVSFADTSRFSVGIYDEARMLTLSPYGRRLLVEAVRDGRKHNAAAWIISQHPDDLGDQGGEDDRIADLLGYRFVFNQERGAAGAALRFLGMAETPENVDLVTSLVPPGRRTRDALLTDSLGRIGRVEMLRELDPEVDAAFDTTPVANGRARV